MNYRYILWDNDGVLVDTERYYLQASREALARVDIELSNQQFALISMVEGRSIFDIAAASGLSGQSIADLKEWRYRRYAELLEQEEITIEGAAEVLNNLSGRVGMAVVTSSLKYHFEIIHHRTGFLTYFDFCLTREDYASSKPSAEPYLLALKQCGHAAKDVLVIEDSPRGLKAAKAAGLACWVIPGDHTSVQDFAEADRVLFGIRDIMQLIL
jgi:HAD superfamily hydrolase (TIGR01509 family)